MGGGGGWGLIKKLLRALRIILNIKPRSSTQESARKASTVLLLLLPSESRVLESK